MKSNIKYIKKRFIVILTLLLIATGSLYAQVFIMDDEVEGNIRVGASSFELPAPYQGGDLDQYLPLGDGVLLLTALGGAYLLKKRKKSKS